MKYRILLDGDRCFPQKKRFLFWNFYPDHPYYPMKYTFDLNSALGIIEDDGVNTQNTPILIKRGDAYSSKLIKKAPTIGAITILLFILMFIILLKKTGMM